MIEGKAADVSIVTNKDLLMTNVSTTNVKSLSIYDREYLDINSSTKELILGQYYQKTIYIKSLSTTSLTVDASSLTISGDLAVWDAAIKVSNNASETNGLTSHVDSFIANSLQITDSSALGALINGKYSISSNLKLYSNGFAFWG